MVLGGRYKVESELGSGGMAVVYKAEDTILGRTVALKTLHAHFAEEPVFRRRFKQEARAMASLDHGNVVKVYDICQDGEMTFIVAEYVDGDDVGDLLARSGSLNEQFTLRIATQLLRAISYAHHRGVIHRDIKPSNILITRDGTVKVGDFGIARLIEDDGTETGEPGEIIGSARYMSPEQLQGREATPRSDIYSVGVLLYHCLTGRPPFSGDVKSLARQQINTPPKPPRRLNKRISPRTEAAILKALAKRPEDRYPSAAAMLADVEGSLPADGAVGTTEARRRPSPHRTGKRRGRLALVTALILLLLGGGSALAAGLGVVELPARGETGRAERALDVANPVQADPPQAPEAPGPETAQASAGESSGEAAGESGAAAGEPDAKETAAGAEDRQVEYAPVPNVNAYFDYWAAQTLRDSGFKVEFVYDYQEGYAPRGVTWGTDPAPGTMAPVGSTITVYATPEDLPQPAL
jgi:serine/threonine-protein kinase